MLALGVLYGLTGFGLARKLGMATPYGEELLRIHKKTFRSFWAWSDGIETIAPLKQQLTTVFGWRLSVRNDTKSNTIRNFPMQANGAEMMRVAAIMAMESNIRVCCPIHDAFLIESSVEDIESDTEKMREIMRTASEIVLPGFPLRTDYQIVRYPDRFSDARGSKMWSMIMNMLPEYTPGIDAKGAPSKDATPVYYY